MASPEQRALQSLSTELFRLDRQILALVRRQEQLLRQKSQLEASLAAIAPASSRRIPAVGSSTPAPPPHGVWERQRRRPSRPSPPPQPIFTSFNRFSVLSSPRTPASRTPSLGSRRSAAGLGSRTSVSALRTGARVLDIARRLPSALRRNAFETVVIHVGTNDISARRSEVLKEHYRSLLDTARKATDAGILISGPLPTYRRGSERFSRLFALQSWLRGWCAINGLVYVDNWASFWKQPALYRRDGLHPSHRGAFVLSRNIERAVR